MKASHRRSRGTGRDDTHAHDQCLVLFPSRHGTDLRARVAERPPGFFPTNKQDFFLFATPLFEISVESSGVWTSSLLLDCCVMAGV